MGIINKLIMLFLDDITLRLKMALLTKTEKKIERLRLRLAVEEKFRQQQIQEREDHYRVKL